MVTENHLDKTSFFVYNNLCCITNAAMAQLAEHVLGKDEVTGSNPVSSSKKANKLRKYFVSLFLYFKYNIQ